MNIDKVQKIITWLAKSGDKETISSISELLSEIGNYKGKTIQESRQESRTPTPTRMDMASHASAILDGGSSSYSVFQPPVPTYERNIQAPSFNPYDALANAVPYEPTPPMTNELPYSGGSRMMANNVEMTSHADSLL